MKTPYKPSKMVLAICGFCFVLIYLPIGAIIFESFVDRSSTGVRFARFDWYFKVLNNPAFLEPLWCSFRVAIFSMTAAVFLGAAGALAQVRGQYWGKSILEAFFLAPLILPDLVLGIASLVFFVAIDLPLGPLAMSVAHGTFCFSYAYILIKSRLQSFDVRLEEAGLDLGAKPWQVLAKVTWPLCWPAVLASGLTSFAMSFDDFAVSFFTAGVASDTLPMKLYAMVKYGSNPETYALSSLILLVTGGCLTASYLAQSRPSGKGPSGGFPNGNHP